MSFRVLVLPLMKQKNVRLQTKLYKYCFLSVLIHELKKRGNNIYTINTTAYKEGEEEEKKVQVTLLRNFGHEALIDDLSFFHIGVMLFITTDFSFFSSLIG